MRSGSAYGAAAINSVPRRMIQENVEEVCRLTDYTGGLHIQISVPQGEQLARKTFNPRLGIQGGSRSWHHRHRGTDE